MQVTELEKQGLKRSFKIVIEAAQINQETEAELKSAGERVKIPGFRPGFIPMKVLKQRYGKSVQADVLKHVINHSSTVALAERKLRPAMTPQINIEDYKEDGDLVFTMSCELFPDVPEVDFSKITLDRSTFELEESDVDDALTRIAERNPGLERAKEGSKAQTGQVVTIDFKGMIDGVPFEGGTAANFQLELGSGQFIPGFEDQLVGAKEGEDRLVKVTFPAEYHSKELAGKATVFEVKVNEIFTREAPKVDDEFAKNLGFGDLRALREAIRSQLIKEYDQMVRNQLKKQLFDVLEKESEFELPQGMVEVEFNTIWERLKQAQAAGDDSVSGKNDDELKAEYQAIAKRRVKLGILLAEVGNRNKIQVSREELSRAVIQQAGMFPGQENKVMEFYQKNPDRAEDLRGPILEEKAVDLILGKVSFNDKKVSVKDLVAGEQQEGEAGDSAPASKSKAKAAKKKTS